MDIGAYEAAAFALSAAPQVQPACAGASNGIIAVSPGNGCGPYAYDWLPDAGDGPSLSGLPPGQYLLTVTDAAGRQLLDTIAVPAAPSPSLSLAATDVPCGSPAGGSLAASVAGGTAPFQYSWQPAAPDTAALAHLPPGAYALTVTDASGCAGSASASIALAGLLTLSVGGQGIRCYGEAGWLSATPSSGAAPFSWAWAGWPGTDPLAQPLGPGQYAVTVTDAYGCTAAYVFPFTAEPDSLWAGTGSTPQTDLGTPNGTAVVTTISGGTPGYGYEWGMGQTGQSITGLAAGAYTVTVTDAHGCTAIAEVVVDLMVGTGGAGLSALLIYPSPAADWAEISLPESGGGRRVDLVDGTGKVVRSVAVPVSAGLCRLGLEGLAAGAYTVVVREQGRVAYVGRLVKG